LPLPDLDLLDSAVLVELCTHVVFNAPSSEPPSPGGVRRAGPPPRLARAGGRADARTMKAMDSSRRRRGGIFAALVLLAESAVLVARGYPPAGQVVVRCRAGHCFTTIWVPGVSVKAVRLGPWRIQRCPVGRHWSVVTPVRRSDLSWWRLRRARAAHDLRVP